MKVKDLIAQLQTLPPNMQIGIWDGYNFEVVTNFKTKKLRAERVVITKKQAKEYTERNKIKLEPRFYEWKDYERFYEKHNFTTLQRKTFFLIEATNRPQIEDR